MNNKIFFSIITCTYNSQKYLYENILSVKNQSFRDFEHIFIDGFSIDKTVSTIKKYQKNHPSQVQIYQRKPQGIADAMNAGIRYAKGKYLIHLHSDDYLYDSKVLEDTVSFLRSHPSYDWIYGQVEVFKDSSDIKYLFPNWKPFQISWSYLLKFADFIPHQAVFIKKSVFNKYGGFDKNNASAMDYDLWLRIRKVTKWRYFNRVISRFRIHPGSKSTGLENFETHVKTRNAVQRHYSNIIEYIMIWLINKLNDRGYKKRIS